MKLSRREFFQRSGAALAVIALNGSQPIPAQKRVRPLTHQQFLGSLHRYTQQSQERTTFVNLFRTLMHETAWACVRIDGNWIVPSDKYSGCFSRDTFWIAGALASPSISHAVLRNFATDQADNNPSGQIATALRIDGTKPINRDRDEESTLMFVLHSYLLGRQGGPIFTGALRRARDFLLARVVAGRYVTPGEMRTGPEFEGEKQVGTFHYWADTFRPSARIEATPEVISYNQGLLCVALRCLEEFGLLNDRPLRKQAEMVYASLVNPEDGKSLPLREGSTIMDVSALVGEALSLLWWDTPILNRERVQATLEHLTPSYYADGSFLGFKIISDYYGPYRPAEEFSGGPEFKSGDYHKGGSWMLYDVLALYCGARHRITGMLELLFARLRSEVSTIWASHEYISTSSLTLGEVDVTRAKYGWNTFIINLLPNV